MESSTQADSSQAPSRRKTVVYLILCLILLATFFFITKPMVITSSKKSEWLQALLNARNVGVALQIFEENYGSYPNETTINEVRQNTGSDLHLGTKSSNDYFRQLFAAEIIDSEIAFYTSSARTRKPDNRIDDEHLLQPGECAFTYMIGANKDSNPQTPLAAFPMLAGQTLFDLETSQQFYDGKVVILENDGSARSRTIEEDGRVLINGKDIFDPSQPFWNGKAPVIKWPE